MSAIDELLARNREYVDSHDESTASEARPSVPVAVVTCMDARIETGRILGVVPGEAHIIRNAGGNVTTDVLRSLAISQAALGTREIMLIKHTDCGLRTLGEDELRAKIAESSGSQPDFPLGTFDDLEDAVRGEIAKLRSAAIIPIRDHVRGFVFEVESGRLREVD